MRSGSAAYRHLAGLATGDRVPDACYILEYADGSRPDWRVHSVELLSAGVRRLVLIDVTNRDHPADLFTPGTPAALTVLTSPRKTLRTQPYLLGEQPMPMLCDLDQQARYVAKERAASSRSAA